MAEAIHIPSPSAFLRPSPPPQTQEQQQSPPRRTAAAAAGQARRLSLSGSNTPRKKQKKPVPANPTIRKPSGSSAGVDKPKQSKSRNGCQTCKAKRLKCDEEKPECRQCKKRNVPCGGYKKDFKWRPFEETNVKINIDRQNQVLTRPRGKSPSAEGSALTTPATEFPPVLDLTEGVDHALWQGGSAQSNNSSPSRAIPSQPRSTPSDKRDHNSPEESAPPPAAPLPPPAPPPAPSLDMGLGDDVNKGESVLTPESLSMNVQASISPVEHSNSPTLTDILAPFTDQSPDMPDIEMLEDSPPLMMHDGFNMDSTIMEGEFEQITMDIHPPHMTHSRENMSISDSLGMLDLALRPRTYGMYTQPHISDTGTEALTWRYLTITCGVLSIVDGPSENPWRTFIWPMAQQSPALYNAVTAMSAFHAAYDMPQMRLIGQEHKQASLQFLQEGLQNHTIRDETAIAAALVLGFAESWDQHTASGNTHIKGAQALVKRALEQHRRRPLQGDALRRLKFLCNAWVYMDVIARLTAVDSDESNDFDSAFLFLESHGGMEGEDAGFGIDFGMPVDARLDPLMGCANTLFPLIGRVANLVRKVCRSVTNSPSVISQARDLKRALEAWEPPTVVDEPEDPSTDVEHTIQTAEAYRWATLLHLHQSVPELPSLSAAELAQRVLQYLATVPPESRTVIVQVYPLMVAGCEASTEEDRQWVRERWERMMQRMHLGIIEKSATVTEEVWRRRDAYEAQPTTRRKLVATAELHSVRRLGQPLVRTDTGSWGGDPGRTGVVFSYVDAVNETATTMPGIPATGSEIHINGSGTPMQDKKRDHRRSRVIDPAYTVRGHLHWVGVMWDWGWESKFLRKRRGNHHASSNGRRALCATWLTFVPVLLG